jgi:SPP1 gp7 family putative phage head morphogenesis protein
MAYVFKAQKPNDPLDVVGGALTANERKLIKQYLEALKKLNLEVSDPVVIQRIMGQVLAGNALNAANQVPWANFTQSLEPIVTTMATQVVMSATLNLQKLPSKVAYEAVFNLTDPRAIGWAQVRAGTTIRQVNEYSRQAVSKIIQDGLRSKLDPDQVQAAIKRVVGLDSRQATALENFYKKTIEDGTVKGLSYQNAVARAETLGQRYRNTLWNQRAERIARTELAEAANQGRFMSWMEADAQGLIPPNSKKRWMIARDERTCSICVPLDGEIVNWEDNFSIDKLMPTAHPNCRCTAVLMPGEPSAVIEEKIPPTGEYEGYELNQPRNATSYDRGQADVAANNLRDSARVAEPKITRDVIDLSKEHGGEMVGLEYRVKTQSSLAEKIQTTARDNATNVAVESRNMRDVIRYTMVKPEVGYIDMTNNVIIDLRSQGYTVRVINNWKPGSPYLGVNAQIVSPTGQMFELQFHTPKSLISKDKTHTLYKSIRNTRDPLVIDRIDKEMIAIAKSVPFPKGDVSNLGDPILTIKKHYAGQHNQISHGGGGGGKGGGGGQSVGLFPTPTKQGREDYEMLEEMAADNFESEQQELAFRVAAQEWQGEGYRQVQSGLLSGNPSQDAQTVIDEFDASMMSLDNDELSYLYRGQTEGLDNLNVGDSFTSPLFQATSTDSITAAGFSKASGGVLGGIKEGESATILRISPFNAKGVVIPSSQEFEVVLARGTQFTVEGISNEVINGVNMKIIDVDAETP